MIYEDIKIGQKVTILTQTPKWRAVGIVADKQREVISGAPHERVWVDTDRGRRICTPVVLEPAA